MFGLTKEEVKLFRSLNTPTKIQNFINNIPINFEPEGDTCFSPRTVLVKNRAHCIEGAILAALILRINGLPPLVVDLKSAPKDFDHVIAVFNKNNCWGAISKSNHFCLRYRDPVYKSIRELVMSYFPEYYTDDGTKNLRSFSKPVDLSRFDNMNWMTTKEELWEIAAYLDEVHHEQILTKSQIKTLRKADLIERYIGLVEDWKSVQKAKDL